MKFSRELRKKNILAISLCRILHIRDHIEDGDSGDEFFTKRDNAEEDTALFEEYIEKNVDEEKKERVKGFLDSNPEDEKERFLLDYVKNMRWKEEGDDYVPRFGLIWMFILVTWRLLEMRQREKRTSKRISKTLISKIVLSIFLTLVSNKTIWLCIHGESLCEELILVKLKVRCVVRRISVSRSVRLNDYILYHHH